MRLVKATRSFSRRHLAVLALPLALSACEDPTGEGAGGVAPPDVRDLCRMEAVVPLRPRLVVTPLYGEPRALPREVCAACFAGGKESWAVGDRDTIEVHVGDQVIEVANDRRSSLRATNALHGVVLGRAAALMDLGGSWLLWRSDSPPVSLLPLPLAPGQTATMLRRAQDAVTVVVRGERPSVLAVVPVLVLAPAYAPQETVPLDTADGTLGGYLERAEQGVATVTTGGRRVELGDTRTVLSAALVGDTVVAWTLRETIVALAGGGVDRVRAPDSVHTAGQDVVRIDDRSRRLSVVSGGTWVTLRNARKAEDLGGAPLPEGVQSIRLEGAVTNGHIAVVERLQGLDCSVSDRLHIMDLDGHVVQALADEPRLRLHVAPVDDGFGWIEADVGRISP